MGKTKEETHNTINEVPDNNIACRALPASNGTRITQTRIEYNTDYTDYHRLNRLSICVNPFNPCNLCHKNNLCY